MSEEQAMKAEGEPEQPLAYEMSDADKVRLLVSKCKLFEEQLALAETGRVHDALLVSILAKDAQSCLEQSERMMAAYNNIYAELVSTECELGMAQARIEELAQLLSAAVPLAEPDAPQLATKHVVAPSGFPMFLDPGVHSNS